MHYIVTQQISIDRRDYGPGEIVELTEEEAARFVGSVELREAVDLKIKQARKAVKRGG